MSWICAQCNRKNPSNSAECISCGVKRRGSPSVAYGNGAVNYGPSVAEKDDIALEQLLKVLRDEPAHSPLVEKTVELLVVQLMCRKFDGKEVAAALSQMTFALASGPDTMRNTMYALGAASKVSEDCKRAADGMTPQKSTNHDDSAGRGAASIVICAVCSACFIIWGPFRHLGLWWKVLLSPVAIVACFAAEMLGSLVVPISLSLLVALFLVIWWWPLAALVLWLKILLSVVAVGISFVAARLR